MAALLLGLLAVIGVPCTAQNPVPPQQQPGEDAASPGVRPPSPLLRPWQMRMRESQVMQQNEQMQRSMQPALVPSSPAQPPPAPIQVQGPPANEPLAQPSLKVEFVEGKLTVTADRMPLSQVLREVGQRTGLEIRGVQDASGVVSVQFSNASVAQGMQELLDGGINYAVIGGLASAQQIRDARVIILSATSTDNIDMGGPLGAARTKTPQASGAPQSSVTQAAKSTWRAELMSSDPAQQDRGFSEINKLDPKEAFDALQDVITNGDGVARLRALQFMDQDGSLDENQVVGALREALNDQDGSLRDYAIQALGRQTSPDALDALRQQFDAGDAATRLSVLEAISQRSDARSIIQQATNDPDQSVRTMASELLQSSGGQPQPDVQPPGTIQLQPAPDVPPDNEPPDSGDDQPNPPRY